MGNYHNKDTLAWPLTLYKHKVTALKNRETFIPWFGTLVCTALGTLSFS